jgi:hypothetical protein
MEAHAASSTAGNLSGGSAKKHDAHGKTSVFFA